jgi:transposase
VSDSLSVADLLERLAARDAMIAAQARVIEELRAEVAELKRRLGQNSSNSSLPPSADWPLKPAPNSLRSRSGKKSGGQAGHPGRTLSQIDRPDETVVHEPVACGGCGSGLSDAAAVGVARRQVFEAPEPKVAVTEHRIVSRRCGTVTAGRAPAGVEAPVQYGPRTQALIVYLVAGRTHWVHSTSTDRFSLISVHRRRGREGIDAHDVLNHYTGVIVHDAWRPYDCYRDAVHALRNAHLLRELQQVIDVCGAVWAEQARHALLELDTLAAATDCDVDPPGWPNCAPGTPRPRPPRSAPTTTGPRRSPLREDPLLPGHSRQARDRNPRRPHPPCQRPTLATSNNLSSFSSRWWCVAVGTGTG